MQRHGEQKTTQDKKHENRRFDYVHALTSVSSARWRPNQNHILKTVYVTQRERQNPQRERERGEEETGRGRRRETRIAQLTPRDPCQEKKTPRCRTRSLLTARRAQLTPRSPCAMGEQLKCNAMDSPMDLTFLFPTRVYAKLVLC